MYYRCPILWKSSIQKIVAFLTTKAEYIVLYSALREVIAIINLLKEVKGQGFGIHNSTPNIKCKTYENNKICIEICKNSQDSTSNKTFISAPA